MEKLDLTNQNLRKFGVVTMAGALPCFALIVFLIRHKNILPPCVVLSGIFIVLGLALPRALKPVYIFWMGLAAVLGWINTRLILCALFYLVFTPLGLVIRLTGKDLLDRKFDTHKSSYWIKKESQPSRYEKQY